MSTNPYKTQKRRLETAVKNIERAQEKIAEMGATYEQDGEQEHSAACKALFLTLKEVETAVREFKSIM